MKLSKDEINKIIDHLSGKSVLSRRKEFERYSTGRGRILHRHALLYSSLVREIEKNLCKLKVELVETESDEPRLILENSSLDYRRETRIPKEIALYLATRFPQTFQKSSFQSSELILAACDKALKQVQNDNARSK